MDSNNRDLNYEQIVQALHEFGLTDAEIQMRVEYIKEHPEEVELYSQRRDIKPEDVKPYEFRREARQSTDGSDFTGDQYESDGEGRSDSIYEENFGDSENPFDTFEFLDLGFDRFDYADWKRSVEREIDDNGNNYPEIIDDETYNQFVAMNSVAKRIERLLIKSHSEYEKNPDDEIARENFDYFHGLQSILQKQMIETAPAEFISSLNWTENGSREPKKYSLEEAEEFIYHYNCAKVYDKKCQEKSDEIAEFESKHPDMNEIEENEYNILSAKHVFFDIKYNDHMQQVPINIDWFRTVKPGAEPEIMAEKHTAYIGRLLEQIKSIQAKQVELLSSYEIGDLKVNPESEVKDLQAEFNRLSRRMSYLEDVGTMLGIAKDDKELEQQDDGIIKASGKDILALMNSKQRYKARKNIHAMEKGKAPGWLRRQALRLPIGNTEDLITSYIDSGKLDIEDIIGFSREEIGVRAEAKKVARETREKRAREANKPKGQPKKEGEEDKDKSEDEEPVSVQPEGGEDKDVQPESTGDDEHTEKDETDILIEQIMSKFDELSTEARIEVYAKQYGLDEQGKQIFALFDSLSQKGKEDLWKKLYGDPEKGKENDERIN